MLYLEWFNLQTGIYLVIDFGVFSNKNMFFYRNFEDFIIYGD